MADENPVVAALDTLRQRRADLDEESKQVDEAIAALEKLVRKKRGAASVGPNRKSVRTKLVELLEESPQDWSAAEIIHEYEGRGDPIQGRDPSNALRAAFADAKKQGWIISTGVGRYRHSKWASGEEPHAESTEGPSNPQIAPPVAPQADSTTVGATASDERKEATP